MTSPLIAQLTALDDAQLQARLRERLCGARAGFSLGPDEPPEDLILSAYQEAPGDELRVRLRAAFAALLREHVRALLGAKLASPALTPTSDALLERLLLLVGLTGTREALPALKAYLPVFSDGTSPLGVRLFNAIASLAGPQDVALVPWLQDYAGHARLCRLALSALWYIQRPSAVAVLPQVAATLGGGDGALALARTLTALLGSLTSDELSALLHDLEPQLAAAPGAVEVLAEALERVPRLDAAHRRRVAAWQRTPAAAPPDRAEFGVTSRPRPDKAPGGNDHETTQRRLGNLQLARAELLRQHTATKHPVRQQQIANAIADVDRRLAELASLCPTAPSLPPKPDRALLSKPERASADSRTKLGH